MIKINKKYEQNFPLLKPLPDKGFSIFFIFFTSKIM